VAGFVAVLVGFTSSVALVFQAAQALQATPAQTASWIWALGLGMGAQLDRAVLALPPAGADRLVHAGRGAAGRHAGPARWPKAVGAFMVCSALIVLAGSRAPSSA
jgi:benzoate membrane transport protein